MNINGDTRHKKGELIIVHLQVGRKQATSGTHTTYQFNRIKLESMKKEYDILTTVTMDRDNFFDYITEGLIDHLPAKVPQIENKRGKNNFTYNGKDYLIEAFDTEIELVNSIARTYKQPTRNYRLKCLNGESEIDALSYASTKRDLVDSINFNLKVLMLSFLLN